MAMRIFINGQLAQICRIRNGPIVDINVGRGICVIGNSYMVAE